MKNAASNKTFTGHPLQAFRNVIARIARELSRSFDTSIDRFFVVDALGMRKYI